MSTAGQVFLGVIAAATLFTAEAHFKDDRSPIRYHPMQTKGLAPAGRLDIDSTGLLILTQDGRIARQLIGEDSKIEKEYLVRVGGSLTEQGLRLLNPGLSLDGEALQPARVNWQNSDQLRFVLQEGKKRQIRRMCEAVGLRALAAGIAAAQGRRPAAAPPNRNREAQAAVEGSEEGQHAVAAAPAIREKPSVVCFC